MPEVEIFSEVLATLSESFLSLIPGDKDEFLGNHLNNIDVLLHKEPDRNIICISGKISSINKSKQILENCIPIETKEGKEAVLVDSSIQHNDDKVNNSDSNDDAISNSAKTVPSLEDVKQYLRSIGTENLADPTEASHKTSKVTVSKKGRTIKPSVKFRSYDDSSLDELDDSLEYHEDDNFGTRERRKRKLGKPRKFNKSKLDNINALDTESTTENTENLATLNDSTGNVQKNVYLNKKNNNANSKLRISLLYDKDLKSKKGIKKYYEDRLPYKFFCEICSFKSKRESHYMKHLELHSKNPDLKLHRCDKCDFTAIRLSVLQRHSLSHIASDNDILKCDLCPYSTNNEAYLKLHKHKHQNRETLVCMMCNFTTQNRKTLLKHQQSHGMTSQEVNDMNSPVTPKFQCNKCPYQTSIKLAYNRHQKAVHLNQRPHLCDTCGRAFKRTDALQIHKEVHKDKSQRKLPFSCNICHKAFKSMAHVKEHMSVHTTVRSFQCHICGQMFKTRQVQQRHLQGVHLKTTWHECTRCKRSFSSKYTLKRHLRQHDEDGNINLQSFVKKVAIRPVGQPHDLIEGQGNEQMDENATAIQTIMVSANELAEFTPQLQVTGPLQPDQTAEVYIEGLENVATDTVNIVSIHSDEMAQILIPSSEPNYTEHVPQLAPTDTETQNTGIGQDLVASNVKEIYHNLSSEQGLQLIQDKQAGEMTNVRTEYNIPAEAFKLSLDQLNQDADSASGSQLINQVNPELEVLNYETVHYVTDQGQIIEPENDGHYVQIVAPDGQTYRIKVDNADGILNLDTGGEGKILEITTSSAPS